MKLSISDGILYVNNKYFSRCEASNGRPNLPTGRYEVATQFSHAHGKVLPDAYDLGWIGATRECDIVLGGVRGKNGVVPSQGSLGRLLALLEVAEGAGNTVWLEVVN